MDAPRYRAAIGDWKMFNLNPFRSLKTNNLQNCGAPKPAQGVQPNQKAADARQTTAAELKRLPANVQALLATAVPASQTVEVNVDFGKWTPVLDINNAHPDSPRAELMEAFVEYLSTSDVPLDVVKHGQKVYDFVETNFDALRKSRADQPPFAKFTSEINDFIGKLNHREPSIQNHEARPLWDSAKWDSAKWDVVIDRSRHLTPNVRDLTKLIVSNLDARNLALNPQDHGLRLFAFVEKNEGLLSDGLFRGRDAEAAFKLIDSWAATQGLQSAGP